MLNIKQVAGLPWTSAACTPVELQLTRKGCAMLLVDPTNYCIKRARLHSSSRRFANCGSDNGRRARSVASVHCSSANAPSTCINTYPSSTCDSASLTGHRGGKHAYLGRAAQTAHMHLSVLCCANRNSRHYLWSRCTVCKFAGPESRNVQRETSHLQHRSPSKTLRFQRSRL